MFVKQHKRFVSASLVFINLPHLWYSKITHKYLVLFRMFNSILYSSSTNSLQSFNTAYNDVFQFLIQNTVFTNDYYLVLGIRRQFETIKGKLE